MIRKRRKTTLHLVVLLTFFLILGFIHTLWGGETYPVSQGLINDFADVIPPAYEEKMDSLAREVLARAG